MTPAPESLPDKPRCFASISGMCLDLTEGYPPCRRGECIRWLVPDGRYEPSVDDERARAFHPRQQGDAS